MKITYIITGLALGGAEIQLLHLAKRAKRDGHDVVVLSIARVATLREEFIDCGIPVYTLPITSIANIKKLYSTIRDLQPDVIHGHMVHAVIISNFLSVLFPSIRFVATYHNSYEKGLALRTLNYLSLTTARVKLTSVSPRRDDWIIRRLGRNHIRSYRNMIDSRLRSLGPKSPSSGQGRRWIYVGRLVEQKRVDRLIAAFTLYSKSFPFDTLYIYGEGPLRESLNRRESSPNIFFKGRTNEVAKSLRECDYFLITSDWEGLPLALLEAAACGLPIVASNVGNVPEIVKHGVNGYLVESISNVGSYVVAMKSLRDKTKSDPDYERFSQNSLDAFKPFDPEEIYREIIGLYD